MNIDAARGVVVRGFPLRSGYGFADYMLYVDGEALGVIEAKKAGTTLSGVEVQSEKYSVGIPEEVPARVRPLPFLYESTGIETWFTNRLDPEPRSRRVFHFHRPETLLAWAKANPVALPEIDGRPDPRSPRPATFRTRILTMPPVDPTGLWPAQSRAVQNLEESLRLDRPRALIQMATGSGKTVTAIAAAYRLIKYADASRILFLVDRDNLGKQAEGEFGDYVAPDDGRKFPQLYNVQRLTNNAPKGSSRVVITTIQRLYSMLQGEEAVDPETEAKPLATLSELKREPVPVRYNPAIPVEMFDLVFVDECHRSIYTIWRQVLEYFDASLVGLTATPSKQTYGFFNQNLVMEYRHDDAVADGVNVSFDVYKIRTRITEQGATVEAGPESFIGRRERETRRLRWEKLDEDLTYTGEQLDRDVVAPDQIRTVVRTFRDKLFTEIFPGRTWVPKTLIFAKDDSHAEDIVRIVREEFGKGNEFCEKITYRAGTARVVEKVVGPDGVEREERRYKSTGVKADDLLSSFRNSPNPRIAVTVDMIATGTDVKPLEIVMFMRAVKSRNFFEQMKGRGVRVIKTQDLKLVTADAPVKDRFVIVDCVGVCESKLMDTMPLERDRTVGFEKLLDAVAQGSRDPDLLRTLAARLARLERRLDARDQEMLIGLAGGVTIGHIAGEIVSALDVDRQDDEARKIAGTPADQPPPPDVVQSVTDRLIKDAVAPLRTRPELRRALSDVKKSLEQAIDETTKDEITFAAFSDEAKKRAEALVESFESFIAKNRDEITALQVLYSRPYNARLRYDDVRALADAIEAPPRRWTPDVLWRAYETLDRSKVRGAAAPRLLTDVVSLVRYAVRRGSDNDAALEPYGDRVRDRFDAWIRDQQARGATFTDEQRTWLEAMRDHVIANAEIAVDDFEYAPFNSLGGAGAAQRVFGPGLAKVMTDLNEVLAA